jgi:deferrochelatase/peroxidase EfeB
VSGESGPFLSRRQLLAGSGLATAAVVAAAAATGTRDAAGATDGRPGVAVAFHGDHQAGIATPEQDRLVFAAFDLTDSGRAGLVDLLARWTEAAGRMTAGLALVGPSDPFSPPVDTGEALGLPPSRLTVTVGFGPSLFDDRFGLAALRPAALIDLPAFPGDALEPDRTGGDLCIQACADDAQVAFHAVRSLARLAVGTAALRYLQIGFGRTASAGGAASTPRNLLGFRDGTDNPVPTDPGAMRSNVWVDGHGDQQWMHGGSYLVARRIRIHLEAWDRSTLGDQERTIGRAKTTGAPLGSEHERDPVDLDALDSFGTPLIPPGAHIRTAAPSTNHGSTILRRGYNFVDGVDPATGELNAGLFFICFQRDPSSQFVPIQQRIARQDALSSYLVHTGSGIFACPPGTTPGRTWGAELFRPGHP